MEDDFLLKLAGKIATYIAENFKNFTNSKYAELKVNLETAFHDYLKRNFTKYSYMKTLLYRDRPVLLEDHYIPPRSLLHNEEIQYKELLSSFLKAKRNVISGTAGSGKSVLLKKLFLDINNSKLEYVPVLLELRLINNIDKFDLLDHVVNLISFTNNVFNKQQLIYALEGGKLLLMFDGYDEIELQLRSNVESQILNLTEKFPEVPILVTSRPDEVFSSWTEFYIHKLQPLNKEEAIGLLKKIDYDVGVRDGLIEKIDENFYDLHRDFLSNPLLLTMMLLTYEQIAEIPQKIHIFYDQAFETLFHKHDALKSQFKRKSYSGLAIDDFKRIFSAFSFITFIKRQISFSREETNNFLKKSIEIENMNVEISNILNDLTNSVCILQLDGTDYTYSHRSFQEYFTAYYLSKGTLDKFSEILDKISIYVHIDNVIPILYEMNRELVETKWIIPKLKTLNKKIASLNKSSDLLVLFFNDIIINKNETNYTFDSDNLDLSFYSAIRWLTDGDWDKYDSKKYFDHKKYFKIFMDSAANNDLSEHRISLKKNTSNDLDGLKEIMNNSSNHIATFLINLEQDLDQKYIGRNLNIDELLSN